MRNEQASPRLRLLTGLGSLAVLSLLLSCGGQVDLDDGGRALAGSSGIDESGAGGSGVGGMPVNVGPVAGAGGRSICASETTESRALRYAYEFVVEASESMKQPALGSTLTRWQVVKDALAGFAQSVPPTVALGLVTIPADGQCSAASVKTPLAPTTPEHAQSLIDALDAIEPAGGEPADEAVAVAIDDLVAGVSSIDVEAHLVLVLDDVPTPTAQCDSGADASDTLISELTDAAYSQTMGRPVIIGLTDSEQARQSLTSLSDEAHARFLDCGLLMPWPCDLGGTSDPVTLEDRFEWLLATINPPDYACTIHVPALRDNPSVDLSQVTLRMTEDGELTQILTLPRGHEDCTDGFWLEPRGDAITLCPSQCGDLLDKIQQVDFTLEFQFSCL